jgi:hypothetical protein
MGAELETSDQCLEEGCDADAICRNIADVADAAAVDALDGCGTAKVCREVVLVRCCSAILVGRKSLNDYSPMLLEQGGLREP